MQKRNRIIWSYTLEFLEIFSQIKYDQIPISIPLLRDFQKFLEQNYHLVKNHKKKHQLNGNIQKDCEPYLIVNKNFKQNGECILVRSELFPLLSGINKKCIYLAHHPNEYKRMLKNKLCRPLYLLSQLPEKKIPKKDGVKVVSQINSIVRSPKIFTFFRNKYFIMWMRKSVKKLLKNIRRLHTLFDKYSISNIYYGSTINRHGSLVTTFAQSRNIKTFNIQHGIFGEVGHLPINADINIVWGSSHKEYLKSYGAPINKMYVGSPYFPKSNEYFGKDINDSMFFSNKKKKNILVALQPFDDKFNSRMIKDIETAATKSKSNFQITYKLHPDQQSNRYKKLITCKGSRMIPHGKITSHSLISKADLIITQSSTLAFEAILSRKPVVFYSRPVDIYYLEGRPYFVQNSLEIGQLFFKIANDQNFIHILLSQAYLKDKVEGEKNNIFRLLKDKTN